MHSRLARQHHGTDCLYSRAVKNALYSSSDRSAVVQDAKCAHFGMQIFAMNMLFSSGVFYLQKQARYRVCTT